MRRRSRPRRSHQLLHGVAVVFFTSLTILGILGAFVWVNLNRPGSAESRQMIYVAPGQGATAIGATLEQQGLVSDRRLFRLAAMVRGSADRLHAGEFDVPAGLTALDLVDFLVRATPVQRKLTVPEGLTNTAVADLVRATDHLTGSIDMMPPEGSLLPETYYYSRGEARQTVMHRMAEAQKVLLADLWANRALDLPLDTPQEAIVLASIIEKETGISGERRDVASVFINRLRRGMRLQSDPTAIYAITGGEALGRRLLRADLQVDSPYNTYRYAGLPPGPIANPGRAALEAALNPHETDYIYFVADGSGGHVFAATLEQHNANVAAWRRIRKEREQTGEP